MFQKKKKQLMSLTAAGNTPPDMDVSSEKATEDIDKSGKDDDAGQAAKISSGFHEDGVNKEDGGVLREDNRDMEEDKFFQPVSQEEVYRSLDEEINNAKKTHPVSKNIKIEKKRHCSPAYIKRDNNRAHFTWPAVLPSGNEGERQTG